MQRLGLTSFLFVGLAITVLVPLASFGLLETRRVEETSHRESEERLGLLAESVARQTRLAAEGQVRAMESLAAGMGLAGDWKEIVRDALVTAKDRYGGFDGIYAADPKGRAFVSASPPPNDRVDFDYSRREYFGQVQRTHQTAISAVEVGLLIPQPAIHVGVPVLDRAGALVGVLCGSLSLQPGSPIARSVPRLPGTKHLVVLDRVGTVVAASEPRLPDAFAKLPLFAPAAGEAAQLRQGLDGGGRQTNAVVEGVGGPLGWTVVAYEAEADVEAAAVALRRESALVSLGVMLLALLVAAAMATRLGRPMRELAKVAEAVGQGTAGAAPEPRPGEPRELAVLLRVFNQMLERLRAHDAELTSTVARRTAELEHSLEELKATQARLGLSDRMASVGTLAAGVAHEINNPLAYVISNVDFVINALNDPDLPMSEALAALADAREGAERVKRIVKELRVFARAQDDERVAVPLGPLLDSCLGMTANEVRHRARLERVDRATRPALANDGQLSQVFLNLLLNAAHAMPVGAADTNRLKVETMDHPDGVAVEISDTGAGIAPEHLGKIFDPFFTTKPVGQGTGLGLAIAQRLVSNLGGRIEVRSALGKGTTFRVVLAAASAGAQDPVPTPAPVAAAAGRRRVLVIDDESAILRSVARLIGREHELEPLDDAKEALARIRAGAQYDVILCDVMMPRLSGPDFLEALAAISPRAAERVVFLTGGAFSDVLQQRLDTLGNPVLRKPFSSADLRSAIDQVSA